MGSTTDPAVDDPDRIDSNCSQVPIGVEGPTDARCDADAVTFVFRPSGHRVYLCQEHAELVNRFGDDAFADGKPTVYPCDRCNKPTLTKRMNADGLCEECQS
jgi:hypothetical protein